MFPVGLNIIALFKLLFKLSLIYYLFVVVIMQCSITIGRGIFGKKGGSFKAAKYSNFQLKLLCDEIWQQKTFVYIIFTSLLCFLLKGLNVLRSKH